MDKIKNQFDYDFIAGEKYVDVVKVMFIIYNISIKLTKRNRIIVNKIR